MSWATFFLGCFGVGFLVSALSFVLGALRVSFHVHIPLVHHFHAPRPHVGAGHGEAGVAPFNFATTMVFLAWFGGTGYLLTTEFRWLVIPALAGAVGAGVVGAAAVFWVMAHVLWSPAENMRSVDYRMVGVLGRIGTPIREGGTGELIYAHDGTRHSCGARSVDGQAIDKGIEVVVTAYERGIAYVQPWEEFAREA